MYINSSDEQLENLKIFLNSKLSTKSEVEKLCEIVGLSVPTIYRYKKEPELIPYGMYLKIKKAFNQIENSPDYVLPSPNDFILAEERRLTFEQSCANGERYVVTPVFSVNCEVEEFTRATLAIDYPNASNDLREKLIQVRQKRRKEYERGSYTSFELINAGAYRDFYLGVNRFSSLSRKCIEKQIEYLIKSVDFKHVNRRIYLYNTPELPVISCYKVKTRKKDLMKCIIRADDFVAEYSDESSPTNTHELLECFQRFYNNTTNLNTNEDVIRFLKNPMMFPLF